MKPQITINAEPYAVTKWHSVIITFNYSEEDSSHEKSKEDYEASIAVSEDENIGSRILEITFTEELPEGVDEEEIKKLITDEFNKSED
jgi:hypothetical protein